ncbi:MAG: nucleoside triphosphate pyrophosphohydrolase [Acidobacteriota bacterium]
MSDCRSFKDLVELMARLRAPDGCPWDREQTVSTLGPMLIEEAWEVIEAAEARHWGHLRDELGDLLFQIIFFAQIASESGHFDIDQTITRVHEKMTRRHPHVFADATVSSTAEVLVNWEAIKAVEREASGDRDEPKQSILDGVSSRLPALLEAHQLTTKAARVGFDWPALAEVFTKMEEEIGELQVEVRRSPVDARALAGELGDLLFVLVNIARKLGVEPEVALKATNRKFRRRFGHIEESLGKEGRTLTESNLEEMDALWNDAKQLELPLT